MFSVFSVEFWCRYWFCGLIEVVMLLVVSRIGWCN